MSDCIIHCSKVYKRARTSHSTMHVGKVDQFWQVFIWCVCVCLCRHACLFEICRALFLLSHFHSSLYVCFCTQFHSHSMQLRVLFIFLQYTQSIANSSFEQNEREKMDTKSKKTYKLIMALKRIANELTEFYFFSLTRNLVCYCWMINGVKKTWILIQSPDDVNLILWSSFQTIDIER